MKKAFLFLLLTLLCIQQGVSAKELDYLHGHFEKLKSDVDISSGMPVELQDGKILLVCAQGCHDNERNAIFDPETDKIEAIGDFKYDFISRGDGILLPNGKVLYIVETKAYPNFYDEYEDILYKKILKILPGKTDSEKSKNYKSFIKLPEAERAKMYMPIVKRNPELLKKYNEFNELKEKSYYAQLYNPETKDFELTGRTTNDIPRSFNVNMISLKNGNVLVFYENDYIELYDYKTGQFTPVKLEKLRYERQGEIPSYERRTIVFEPLYSLKDGRILGTMFGKFAIYDYDNDNLFISTHYGKSRRNDDYPKLSNDTVVFSWEFEEHKYPKSGREDNMGLASYDPYTDTLKDIGELLIPRGRSGMFRKIRMLDDTVLIIGGLNHRRESLLNAIAPPERSVEIFNPKTGVSKRKKRSHYQQGFNYFLLNDGRVLLYGWENKNELFVPKNYKKNKNKSI